MILLRKCTDRVSQRVSWAIRSKFPSRNLRRRRGWARGAHLWLKRRSPAGTASVNWGEAADPVINHSESPTAPPSPTVRSKKKQNSPKKIKKNNKKEKRITPLFPFRFTLFTVETSHCYLPPKRHFCNQNPWKWFNDV